MHILEKVSRTPRLIKKKPQLLNIPFPYLPSSQFLFPTDTRHLTINFPKCGHLSSVLAFLVYSALGDHTFYFWRRGGIYPFNSFSVILVVFRRKKR